MLRTSYLLLLPILTGAAGCAHTYIEGTQVPDTDENRSVVQVLGELSEAMRSRDTDRLIGLVSRSYFEDMGTPDPADDYGYVELTTNILPQSMAVTKELYIDFRVHDVVVDGDRAYADVRYSSRALIDLPTGNLWDKHAEFNRVELEREDGSWRITRGL